MASNVKGSLIALGKIAYGCSKIAGGYSTAVGGSITARLLKAAHLEATIRPLVKLTVESGAKLIDEGWKELTSK